MINKSLSIRHVTGPTTVLALTLFALNGPFADMLMSLAIFLGLSWFGSILIANSQFHVTADGQIPTWELQVGPFLVGGTIAILVWEASIALNLQPNWGGWLLILGLIGASILRGRQLTHQHLDCLASTSFNLARFISTSVISLLLTVAAVPDLRSWLIPLSIMNVLAHLISRYRSAATLIVFVGSVLIVRHSTADPSILVFTDDSIWAESFSSIIGQTGFWSWGGLSDIYLPLHWFAYGIAGWFTRATDDTMLFGVTKAFPAVMSVVAGFIVSNLRIKENEKLSFVLQVLAVICGLQIIGSESISADLGFVAVLAFALLLQRKQSNGILTYITLICVGFAKVQFVPVAMILIVVANLLHVKTVAFSVVFRRIVIQLVTIVVVVLLVLDKIPLSKIFGWETRDGWGYSMVRFRGSELLRVSSLLEVIKITIFVFVPAIVILLVYLLTHATPRLSDLAAPLSVTAASLSANILFEINNFIYFGWISTAMCVLFLFEPLVENAKAHSRTWVKASTIGFVLTGTLFIFLWSQPKYDSWQSIQRTQFAVTLSLAMFTLLFSFTKLGRRRHTAFLKSILGFSGISLLCLPLLVLTSNSFRESRLVSIPTSGFSLSELGYTDDLLQAGNWVRQYTNDKEIIATNILCELGTYCYLDGRPLVAAATHRRTYIEAERFAFGYSPIHTGGSYPDWIVNRLKASLNCSEFGDAASCAILDSAGINLIIVDSSRNSVHPNLKICKSFGTIRVVSIDKSLDGAVNCPQKFSD